MSKHNKVNKSNYVQAGRLTPDDMARERQKMRTVRGSTGEGGKAPGGSRAGRTSKPASETVRGAAQGPRSRQGGREE